MFDKNWISVPANDLSAQQLYILIRMSPLKSNIEGSKIQILDMLNQEVKMTFKLGSIVGVGSGMLYCDAEEVLDTRINHGEEVVVTIIDDEYRTVI